MKDWRRRLMMKSMYKNRIIGTCTEDITITMGGQTLVLTAPEFNVLYTGGTVTSLASLFRDNTALTSIDHWGIDLSGNSVSMWSAFRKCLNIEYIDLEGIKTTPTTLAFAFSGCTKLKSIDLTGWEINGISLDHAFSNSVLVNSLQSLKIKISGACTFNFTFENVNGVIDFTGSDFGEITSINNAFYHCFTTKIIGGLNNLKTSVRLSSARIDHDNAVEILQSLGTPSGDAQTIVFGKTIYDTLTADEIKIATDKNWTVASA